MQYIGGYIWNFLNRFGSQVISLLTNIILAHYLSPEEFGIIGVLSILFLVASTLTESGLGGALIIQKELRTKDCDTIFFFNTIVSVVLYILIYLFSDLLQEFYDIDKLSTITRIISLIFIINGLCVVPRTILCYNLKFKELCIITHISAIFSSILSIISAILNFGVYSLVIFQLTSAIITTGLSLYISKYKPTSFFSWLSFRNLFGFGFYTTITGVLDTIYENLMAAIYGKWLSVSSAGYLSQAKKLEEASTQSILSTVNNTTFPILSKQKENLEVFKKEADKILQSITLFIFPLMFVIYAFGEEIVVLLFGELWQPAAAYLKILVFAGLFMILDSIVRNYIKSMGLVDKLFKLTIIKRVIGCMLILSAALISKNYIIYAYAISAFIGYILTCLFYSSVINNVIYETLFKSLKYINITIPLFIIMVLTHFYLCDYRIAALIVIIEISIYYYMIFKYLSINPINLLKNE